MAKDELYEDDYYEDDYEYEETPSKMTKQEKRQQRALEKKRKMQNARNKTKGEKGGKKPSSKEKEKEKTTKIAKKKKEKESMKDKFKGSRNIFKDYEIVVICLVLFFAHFFAIYVLTSNLIYSVIMGVIGMVFFFFEYAYPNRKLKLYQQDLQSLLEYVMNMSFFLSNNQNVLTALNSAHTMASPRIKKDIEIVIHSLEDTTELYTENFRKYNYPALNQFHANLVIYYQKGGDAQAMFEHIQNSMAFELRKRDELHRKRKGLALNVYVLLGIVVLIAYVLRFLVSEMWTFFLEYQLLSLGTLTLTFGAIMLNLRALQKHNLDISVKH